MTRSAAQTGLVIIALGMLIAPGMDVFAKLLTDRMSPGMVAFARFVCQSILLIPLITATNQWRRPRAGFFLAGIFLGLALLTINAALREMPIANALAIFFVEPLLLTALSAVILGETIGRRRVMALVVGLGGAIIVLRPNLAEYGWTALYPLATAVFFASYILTTKVMARGGNLLNMQFWTGLGAVGVLGLAGAIDGGGPDSLAGLSWPATPDWTLILAMGGLAVLTHQMMAQGLARADASLVAPLQYLEIVSGTLLGWWVFGDLPDALTWVGAAVIIGAGLYVFHRERKVNS